MQYDIWKFISVMLAAVLVGLSIGAVLPSLLLAAIGVIVWQSYRMNQLYHWVIDAKANPIHGSSGQAYLIHRELYRQHAKSTLRKQQMRKLLKQFRKAMGALPDAIILIDEAGKIEWANSNAYSVLGIRWPDDAKVRFSDLLRYPEVDQLLKQTSSSAQGVEISSVLQKGSTINIKCVRYTDSLRMVVARDVSRLVKVNQMHADFVANVSHELKTPLTVLRGYLEILEDSQEMPSKFVKSIEQMNLQSVRMQLIVNDLLYLAKLEDNHNIATHEPINITLLINTILESVQPLIEEKHHKLELDIDYEVQILGAHSELHSAFANLLTNAIHYTPNNGSIRVKCYLDDGLRPVFSVTDNGLGIAKQHLSRLTQRFYRVDDDRSREGGGTGLGLAIVKHVIGRHSGSLEIKSVAGEGSEFKCIFPHKSKLIDIEQNAKS